MKDFLQNRIFLDQEVKSVQRCCFQVKGSVLSFSEHQKSLKSIHYSWDISIFVLETIIIVCERVYLAPEEAGYSKSLESVTKIRKTLIAKNWEGPD